MGPWHCIWVKPEIKISTWLLGLLDSGRTIDEVSHLRLKFSNIVIAVNAKRKTQKKHHCARPKDEVEDVELCRIVDSLEPQLRSHCPRHLKADAAVTLCGLNGFCGAPRVVIHTQIIGRPVRHSARGGQELFSNVSH